MEDQPRSSARDEKSSHESETNGGQSRGSSIQEKPWQPDEPIFIQSLQEFLTPKGNNSTGNNTLRIRDTWGWPMYLVRNLDTLE
jgi:hypothetical protein